MKSRENRRSLLKGIGASIGLPALSLSEISVNAAAEPTRIVEKRKPFLHFTFESSDTFEDMGESVGCRTWPTMDTLSGKRTGTESKVYITELGRQSLNLDTANGAALTHRGFHELENQTEIQLGNIPCKSSLVGGVRFFDDTSAPSLSVDLDQNDCQLEFGGAKTSLKKGENEEFTLTTELSDGRNAELTASVAYYGNIKLVGHKNKIFLPQSKGWSNFIQAIKKSKQQEGQSMAKSEKTRLEITEYKSTNAIGIDTAYNNINGGN